MLNQSSKIAALVSSYAPAVTSLANAISSAVPSGIQTSDIPALVSSYEADASAAYATLISDLPVIPTSKALAFLSSVEADPIGFLESFTSDLPVIPTSEALAIISSIEANPTAFVESLESEIPTSEFSEYAGLISSFEANPTAFIASAEGLFTSYLPEVSSILHSAGYGAKNVSIPATGTGATVKPSITSTGSRISSVVSSSQKSTSTTSAIQRETVNAAMPTAISGLRAAAGAAAVGVLGLAAL